MIKKALLPGVYNEDLNPLANLICACEGSRLPDNQAHVLLELAVGSRRCPQKHT